jgi:hypothetical protein
MNGMVIGKSNSGHWTDDNLMRSVGCMNSVILLIIDCNNSRIVFNICGCVFSRPDSLQRHREAKHDQIGRGLKRPAEDDYKSSPKRRVTIEKNNSMSQGSTMLH